MVAPQGEYLESRLSDQSDPSHYAVQLQIMPKVAAKSCCRKKLPQKVATNWRCRALNCGGQGALHSSIRSSCNIRCNDASGPYIGAGAAVLTSPIVVPLVGRCQCQLRIDQLAATLLTILAPPVIEIQLASDGRHPWSKRLQSLCISDACLGALITASESVAECCLTDFMTG